jgi:hypothetical protein
MTREEHIQQIVNDWPPFTAAQRDVLYVLLEPMRESLNRMAVIQRPSKSNRRAA